MKSDIDTLDKLEVLHAADCALVEGLISVEQYECILKMVNEKRVETIYLGEGIVVLVPT